ncbi:hypothetical protein N6H14_09605 [Paenibacillus sp. CC-CFT747]|nr:hypothetical protein N6H14_09605 [Paenibacillus sp. CC-CFT747]
MKDPWFDGVLGGIASDGFIVPAAGVFLTVYRIGWPGMAAAALAFMGIEILFLSLGVYADNWWNVLYTGLSLPVFFLIARWIWRLIRCRMDRALPRFLILYFVNLTLQFSLVFLYSALLGALHYRLPWFADVSRGHVVFLNLCVLSDSLLFAGAAAAGVRRAGLLAITGILLAVNLLLFRYGLIRSPHVLNLLGLTLVQAASLFLLTAFRRLLIPRS